MKKNLIIGISSIFLLIMLIAIGCADPPEDNSYPTGPLVNVEEQQHDWMINNFKMNITGDFEYDQDSNTINLPKGSSIKEVPSDFNGTINLAPGSSIGKLPRRSFKGVINFDGSNAEFEDGSKVTNFKGTYKKRKGEAVDCVFDVEEGTFNNVLIKNANTVEISKSPKEGSLISGYANKNCVFGDFGFGDGTGFNYNNKGNKIKLLAGKRLDEIPKGEDSNLYSNLKVGDKTYYYKKPVITSVSDSANMEIYSEEQVGLPGHVEFENGRINYKDGQLCIAGSDFPEIVKINGVNVKNTRNLDLYLSSDSPYRKLSHLQKKINEKCDGKWIAECNGWVRERDVLKNKLNINKQISLKDISKFVKNFEGKNYFSINPDGTFAEGSGNYAVDFSNIPSYEGIKIYSSKKGTFSLSQSKMDFGNEILRFGSKGDEVGNLQERLNKLGYKGKDGKPLVVDNDFKENTQYAVKKFQEDNSALGNDGLVGENTKKALDSYVFAELDNTQITYGNANLKINRETTSINAKTLVSKSNLIPEVNVLGERVEKKFMSPLQVENTETDEITQINPEHIKVSNKKGKEIKINQGDPTKYQKVVEELEDTEDDEKETIVENNKNKKEDVISVKKEPVEKTTTSKETKEDVEKTQKMKEVAVKLAKRVTKAKNERIIPVDIPKMLEYGLDYSIASKIKYGTYGKDEMYVLQLEGEGEGYALVSKSSNEMFADKDIKNSYKELFKYPGKIDKKTLKKIDSNGNKEITYTEIYSFLRTNN